MAVSSQGFSTDQESFSSQVTMRDLQYWAKNLPIWQRATKLVWQEKWPKNNKRLAQSFSSLQYLRKSFFFSPVELVFEPSQYFRQNYFLITISCAKQIWYLHFYFHLNTFTIVRFSRAIFTSRSPKNKVLRSFL